MDMILPKSQRPLPSYLIAGICFFISALFYYAVFRSVLPWPGYLINLNWAHLNTLSDYSLGSYPSFAFAVSMGLIATGLFISQRARMITAIFGVWVVGLVHEVSMGTFAYADVVAGTLGSTLALLVSLHANTKYARFSEGEYNLVKQSVLLDRVKLVSLMVVSMSFATGTSQYETTDVGSCLDTDVNGTCIERQQVASPVYLSYENLRSAVKVTAPRSLTSVSRIYLYKNLLFANEKNEGIHIIDNSVPTSPQRLAFIEIPGNTEIAIREENLYADSYIDLVTLDVSNLNDIIEIAREESIFPYNALQNIPSNVRLAGTIDSSRGVVVSYR